MADVPLGGMQEVTKMQGSDILLLERSGKANRIKGENVLRYINSGNQEMSETVDSLSKQVETLNNGGLNLKDAVIDSDIRAWLAEHPEATTTVQDGAITSAKLHPSVRNGCTIIFHGDSNKNWTETIQNAVDTYETVTFVSMYDKDTPVHFGEIRVDTRTKIFGNGTICTGTFKVMANKAKSTEKTIVSGGGSEFHNLAFVNCEEAIIASNGRNVLVEGCNFKLCEKAIYADTTPGKQKTTTDSKGDVKKYGDTMFHRRGIWTIVNNIFSSCQYSLYLDYNTDYGEEANMDDVPMVDRWMRNNDWIVSNNQFISPTISAIWIRGLDGITCTSNMFMMAGDIDTKLHAMEIVKGDYITFTSNHVFENGRDAIVCGFVKNITVSNNHFSICGTLAPSAACRFDNLQPNGESGYADLRVNITGNILAGLSGQYAFDFSRVLEKNLTGIITNNVYRIGSTTGYSKKVYGIEAVKNEDKLFLPDNTGNCITEGNLVHTSGNTLQFTKNKRKSYLSYSLRTLSYEKDVKEQIENLPSGMYHVCMVSGTNGRNVQANLPTEENYYLEVFSFDNGFYTVIARPMGNANASRTYTCNRNPKNGWSGWVLQTSTLENRIKALEDKLK